MLTELTELTTDRADRANRANRADRADRANSANRANRANRADRANRANGANSQVMMNSRRISRVFTICPASESPTTRVDSTYEHKEALMLAAYIFNKPQIC